MTKVIIFAALLSVAAFGTQYAIANFAPDEIKSNQMLLIAVGFVGYVVAIYLVTMLGFHV